MIYSPYLLPVITKPTRITNHTATLMDHSFTKTVNRLTSGIVTVDISDHLPFASLILKVKWKQKCTKHQDQKPNKVPGCVYRSKLTLGRQIKHINNKLEKI